jgi:hypothetical protein
MKNPCITLFWDGNLQVLLLQHAQQAVEKIPIKVVAAGSLLSVGDVETRYESSTGYRYTGGRAWEHPSN